MYQSHSLNGIKQILLCEVVPFRAMGVSAVVANFCEARHMVLRNSRMKLDCVGIFALHAVHAVSVEVEGAREAGFVGGLGSALLLPALAQLSEAVYSNFLFVFLFLQLVIHLLEIHLINLIMLAPSRSPQRPICPPCVQYSPRPQPSRRVQKVPYERKVIQYETYEYEEQVPKQVKKIQYEEKTVIDYVPVQRKVTDYYAVETAKTYVTQTHQNRRVQMVPVERTVTKVNYKPVTRVVQNKPPQLGGVQSPSRQNYSPYQTGNNFNPIQPSVPQFWPTAQSVVSGRPTFSQLFVQKCYQAGFSEDTPMTFDQFMEVLARLKNKSFDKPIIDKVWGEAQTHTPAQFARVIKGTSLEEQL